MDDFLLFWMDELLICSNTEEEHLKHIQLVFEKLSRSWDEITFFKSKKECLGHLVSGKGISLLKQKVKAIRLITHN